MKKETLQEKRNRLAKETCQELRIFITAKVVDQNFQRVYQRLAKWMNVETGKVRYGQPTSPIKIKTDQTKT